MLRTCSLRQTMCCRVLQCLLQCVLQCVDTPIASKVCRNPPLLDNPCIECCSVLQCVAVWFIAVRQPVYSNVYCSVYCSACCSALPRMSPQICMPWPSSFRKIACCNVSTSPHTSTRACCSVLQCTLQCVAARVAVSCSVH